MAGTRASNGSQSSGAAPVGLAHQRNDSDDRFEREVHAPPPRRRWIAMVLLLLLIGAGVGGWWWWKQSRPDDQPASAAAPPASSSTTTTADADTPKHYPPPVPPIEQAEAKPLPSLDQSEAMARDALVELLGSEPVSKLFSTQDLIRHIVVTVDNLPRKTVAARLNPVKPASGEFKVGGDDAQRVIAPGNAARYAPYVKLAEQVDAKKIVSMYGRMYPLFQKAYEDLGYPKSFFNDRLIAVIDHLLATPEVTGPIAIVAPHVQYQYADPELEAQSAGRKFLMRAGPENAAAIKSKLREIRRELTKTGTGK